MYEVALHIILKGDTYITFKYYNNDMIFYKQLLNFFTVL